MQVFLVKSIKHLFRMDVDEIIQSRAARDVVGSLLLNITGRIDSHHLEWIRPTDNDEKIESSMLFFYPEGDENEMF